LGDSIILKIVEISADRVKVGIEAPRDVEIWREELAAQKSAANNSVSPEAKEQAA
jgi:carbon storage regulator CsrA